MSSRAGLSPMLKTMLVLGEHWLDYYYRADEPAHTTAA